MYPHLEPLHLFLGRVGRSGPTSRDGIFFLSFHSFFFLEGWDFRGEGTLMCRFRGMITCDSSLEKRVSDGPILSDG